MQMSSRETVRSDWKDVARHVKDQLQEDRVPLLAAGVAFFSLLALFPALIAVISIYGMFSDPQDVEEQIADLTEALPDEASDLLVEQLSGVADIAGAGLGITAVVSIAAALWSASKGVQYLIIAVNSVFDQKPYDSNVKLRIISVVAMLAGIVVVLVLFTLVAVLPALLNGLGLGVAVGWVINIGRWPVIAALVVVALSVLYAYAPNRERPAWSWVSWGAVIAAGLWVLGSIGLSVYVGNFGGLNETYGSLTAVIVLLLWLFLGAFVILLGAEINAALEREGDHEPSKPDTEHVEGLGAGTGDGAGKGEASERSERGSRVG
jgi:membrane protein